MPDLNEFESAYLVRHVLAGRKCVVVPVIDWPRFSVAGLALALQLGGLQDACSTVRAWLYRTSNQIRLIPSLAWPDYPGVEKCRNDDYWVKSRVWVFRTRYRFLTLTGAHAFLRARLGGSMLSKITAFDGDYRFLSNFWPAVVELDGVAYPTVEHAYQAAKTSCPQERERIRQCTPGNAKRMGKSITLCPDWDQVKLAIMQDLVQQKFTRHAELGAQLLATGSAVLIEGNGWGDCYWGVCRGQGENHLGKILMAVRAQLQQGQEQT